MTTVQYTLIITNGGPLNATGIVVDHAINSPCILKDHSLSLGSYSQASGKWIIGNLAVGSTAMATFTVEKPAGDFPVRASVSGDQIDNIIINNTDVVVVQGPEEVDTCVNLYKAYPNGDNYRVINGILEETNDCMCTKCTTVFSIVSDSTVNILTESFNLEPHTGRFSFMVANSLNPWEFEYTVECINCVQDHPGAATKTGPWGPAKVQGAGLNFAICKDETYVPCCDDVKKIDDPNVFNIGDCEGDNCFEARLSSIIEAIGEHGLIENFTDNNCEDIVDPCAVNVLEVQHKDCDIPKIGVNLQKIRDLIFSCVEGSVANVAQQDTTCSGIKVYDIREGDTPCGSGRTVYYLAENTTGVDVIVTATGQAQVTWPEDFSGDLVFTAAQECIDGASNEFEVTISRGCCNPCYNEFGTAAACANAVTALTPCEDTVCRENRMQILGADGVTVCQACSEGDPIVYEDGAEVICANRQFQDQCGNIVQGTLMPTDWSPLPEEVCLGEQFIQKSQCCPGMMRDVDDLGQPLVGTKDPGLCFNCYNGILTPKCAKGELCDPDTGTCGECYEDCHCDELNCKGCVDNVCVCTCPEDEHCDGHGECRECLNNSHCDVDNCEICTEEGCVSKCEEGQICVNCNCEDPCTPDTSCAATTCIGEQCPDGCGGMVDGTLDCSVVTTSVWATRVSGDMDGCAVLTEVMDGTYSDVMMLQDDGGVPTSGTGSLTIEIQGDTLQLNYNYGDDISVPTSFVGTGVFMGNEAAVIAELSGMFQDGGSFSMNKRNVATILGLRGALAEDYNVILDFNAGSPTSSSMANRTLIIDRPLAYWFDNHFRWDGASIVPFDNAGQNYNIQLGSVVSTTNGVANTTTNVGACPDGRSIAQNGNPVLTSTTIDGTTSIHSINIVSQDADNNVDASPPELQTAIEMIGIQVLTQNQGGTAAASLVEYLGTDNVANCTERTAAWAILFIRSKYGILEEFVVTTDDNEFTYQPNRAAILDY